MKEQENQNLLLEGILNPTFLNRSPRLTKFEKINVLQESIKLVASVSGGGVAVPGSGDYASPTFFPLIDDKITKGILNKCIEDLSKLLVEENKKLFR